MTDDKKNSAKDTDITENKHPKNESEVNDIENSKHSGDDNLPDTKMGQLKTNIKDTIEYKSRPLEWYYYAGFAILIAIWIYGRSMEDQEATYKNPALNGATKSEVCLEFVKSQSPMNGDFNRATIDGDIITVHQVRGGEGKIFFYDCKISENSIVWRINKLDGGMGPWQGTAAIPAATFTVANGEVLIN
jgi:hypothetical protein